MARRKKPEHLDPNIAIVAGDGFYRNADLFVTTLEKLLKRAEAGEISMNDVPLDIGFVIAAATEMCLAVELYLKAIWIRLGLDVPDTHNLWKLFKDLPSSEFAEVIYQVYEKQNAELPPGGPALARLYLSVGTEEDHELERPELHSVKDVLKYCEDGFVTWRYLFEKGEHGKTLAFDFPFARLKIIAQILRNIKYGPEGNL
jgi:HEPN domain-containing protein